MSKRPHGSSHRLGPDPEAANVRDPEQKGDALERKPTPRREDPTQRDRQPAKPRPKGR